MVTNTTMIIVKSNQRRSRGHPHASRQLTVVVRFVDGQRDHNRHQWNTCGSDHTKGVIDTQNEDWS